LNSILEFVVRDEIQACVAVALLETSEAVGLFTSLFSLQRKETRENSLLALLLYLRSSLFELNP
jgi:hypothetical protein